jgi:hypothetical protein
MNKRLSSEMQSWLNIPILTYVFHHNTRKTKEKKHVIMPANSR